LKIDPKQAMNAINKIDLSGGEKDATKNLKK
jgi:hypothetical protein